MVADDGQPAGGKTWRRFFLLAIGDTASQSRRYCLHRHDDCAGNCRPGSRISPHPAISYFVCRRYKKGIPMASSFADQIPTIVYVLEKLNAKTVLDVGKGFGKHGFLLHEYVGIDHRKKPDPHRTLAQQSRIATKFSRCRRPWRLTMTIASSRDITIWA
jgi:hypothetical protein